MITLAIMVVVCAILGTIAMGMMFDPAVINSSEESFNSYVSNGSYWAFQKLGQYFGIGDTLLIVYALCNAIGQLSTLVISIDAPLRMLLDNEESQQFIPAALLKKNDAGAYVNGIKMVAILSGSIILIQSFVPGAAAVLKQLTKLNSVCMPMRYLWVFTAYIALRKAGNRYNPEYRFVQNDTLALVAGAWCFFVTAACCLLGVYDTDPFTMCLNIITPCVLTALGIINEPILWLTNATFIMPIVIVVALWSSMGVGFLAMLAGLLNVSPELYEAGAIDGVKNPFQEVIYITIPSMKPQMLFGAVMAVTNAFQQGAIGTMLTGANPTPSYAAQLMVNHVEDYGFIRYEMGYAAAVSVALLALIYAFSFVARKLFEEKD
jgi:ABC-type sugar transport system permease subunit